MTNSRGIGSVARLPIGDLWTPFRRMAFPGFSKTQAEPESGFPSPVAIADSVFKERAALVRRAAKHARIAAGHENCPNSRYMNFVREDAGPKDSKCTGDKFSGRLQQRNTLGQAWVTRWLSA
jgi:hypothetical protein